MKQHEIDESRKLQIKEIMDKCDELIALIVESEDYTRYAKGLEELKASAGTYKRVNEFRLKNLALELLDEEDNYDKMQELHAEYKDVLMEPLVSHFMIKEQSICKLMRKVQNHITEGVPLDISYLDSEE